MNATGLSRSRLKRLHNAWKEIPGMVALVSHHDDVHVEVLGTMAFDNPKSIKRDTIFRIASLQNLLLQLRQ
jgi:hypothetical protein